MTTTTSTTTTTPSTSSVISSATQSLLTSLGSGSGVDTSALVTSLVSAQFANQAAALSAKSDTLTSQISTVASVKSAITTFSTALTTLVKGGTLTTQPVSSNTSVLTASALTGAKLAGLSSSISVSQLAAAQTAVTTTAVADRTAPIGTGTFTLTFGTATVTSGKMSAFTAGSGTPVTIAIPSGSNSLDGIAAAINGANAGVTASIVTDDDGSAYLSLKGATGAAQAFTLRATSDPTRKLAQFNVGVNATGTKLSSTAQNAKLTVDGVAVERDSNTISDLVTGAKLTLTGTGTTTMSSKTPTDALSTAVTDFVDAYNEVMSTLKAATDPINGVLKNDTAANALMSQLKGITLTNLVPGSAAGTPTTLASIGVGTNKDGTLSVNSDTLTRALSDTPQAVEAMFAWSTNASSGLASILSSLSLQAGNTVYGLGASTATYTSQQSDVGEAQDDLATQKDAATTRLTAQFAGMNSRVAAYKSVQSFLTSQIAAWNKSS